MAEEWWSSARTVGDHASACSSTSPATADAAASSRPTNPMSSLQQPGGLPDSAAASSSFFLVDPHMDWAQSFMQGKVAEAEQPTSLTFNSLLQLQGDASHQFLLGQAAASPVLPYSVSDGAAGGGGVAGSQQCVSSFYADSQQQQQFPSFFSSSGLFGTPAAQGLSPPLLLQAQKPKPLKSSSTEPAVQDACSSSATRSAAAKRPRTETRSPMPTFKVRKEKLGDRITALQQMVSPFGKTDTASVLHEATGYIKFLHDQVASLSSPYFIKCSGRPVQLQHKLGSDNDGREAKEDLRSRGLCLIPVASTYAVASETAPEFWHPTFGGTFR